MLISYLLLPRAEGVIASIIAAASLGTFTLLLPEELLEELALVTREKPYLASRIRPEQVDTFVQALREIGEPLSPIEEQLPPVSRDAKDDYLLAAAVISRADFLVTGDKDLLVLGEVERLKILTPTAFATLLAAG